MTRHVLVVASGFGMRLIPWSSPYRFSLLDAHQLLKAERCVEERWFVSTLHPTTREHRGDIDTVGEVVEGPSYGRWWLETKVYRLPLLPGWCALASAGPQPVAFDLIGPSGALAYIQTPRNLPKLADLVAPGQQVLSLQGGGQADFIDLAYEHDARPWRQRHLIRRLRRASVVVTIQAPAAVFHEILPDGLAVANDLADTD